MMFLNPTFHHIFESGRSRKKESYYFASDWSFYPEKYERLEVLGEGSFGEVYKCKQNDTGDIVAIKYLKQTSMENLDQFRREIENLYKENKNLYIVDIFYYDLNDSKPYFVMEFCELGSLSEYIGKLDHKDVANILLMLVQALKTIHKNSGFHRDIKPQNILLKQTEKGWIAKLSDFGLARIPNPHSQMTQTPCGTIKYMSPEVRRGEKYTSASDIYSLGATCKELLTGSIDPIFLNPKIPTNLWQLLREMTWEEANLRPNLEEIEKRTNKILEEWNTPFWGFFSSMSWSELGLIAGVTTAAAIYALDE